MPCEKMGNNLELQIIVLFDYLNQLMMVKLTNKVNGGSECLQIKPLCKEIVTVYGELTAINSIENY